MKRFLCAVLAVMMLAGCASAEGVKIGTFASLNMTEEEAYSTFTGMWYWHIFADGHGEDDRFIYYDSLPAMLLALEKGDVDEIDVSEIVAEYVMNTTPSVKVSCVTNLTHASSYTFGFLAENAAIRDKFNDALGTLEANGTMEALRTKYLDNPGKTEPESVKFEKFSDAETLRVAVTGDLPPLDYVAADGEPAGFNTAVLAEIGRLLKVNITTMNIDSGARAAALTSGRADAVFWIEGSAGVNSDAPDGIIISRPYYKIDNFLHLRKK